MIKAALKFLLNVIVGLLGLLIIGAFIWFVYTLCGGLWRDFVVNTGITAFDLAKYFLVAFFIIIVLIIGSNILFGIGAGTIHILKNISKHNNTD